MSAWIEALRALLPPGRVITDRDILDGQRRDHAALVDAGHAAALVRPTSTAEVQAIVRLAAAEGVPVVPRGAGSGLAGGANAIDGCLMLSLAGMDRILEIDRASQLAVVQPGVINATLAAAARDAGLWYAPDPASWEFSTLGGNVATNAGGLCCVKYGVTRESVLGLEVVLASGELLRTGARTLKRVAGYDLTRLFVGSEGTLGVITEITLRLRPPRRPAATLAASFPTLDAAGRAIGGMIAAVTPSLLELMDQRTIRAVDDWKPMGLDRDAAAMLFARSDAGSDAAAEIAGMAAACEAAGASLVVTSTDAAEGELLLAARRLAYPALERLGATLLDDVAVPVAALPPMIAAIADIAAAHDVTIGTFGHAGDGNLHPTLVFDAGDLAATARARAAFAAVVRAALALGGTVSGEHGIGLLKRDLLADELGPTALSVQRSIKQALDPRGILNPGKVLPRLP